MSMHLFDFARRERHVTRCGCRPWWFRSSGTTAQGRGAAILLGLWLLVPAVSTSQTAPPTGLDSRLAVEDCEGPGQTLDVKAERMTFDRQTQTFLFRERVRVQRCDMTILCDKLRVFNDAAGERVERILATGNVRFRQGARRITAERAEYFDTEQKIILTGQPRAWDTVEKNELSGEEIVLFLEEDKLFVKQAHVRFHPRQQTSQSQ